MIILGFPPKSSKTKAVAVAFIVTDAKASVAADGDALERLAGSGRCYVGDKLGVLSRALSWLTPAGLFIADLDLGDVRSAGGAPAGRHVARWLRAQGVAYDARRHRVRYVGRRELRLPVRFLGADDQGGPNYTGQPSVTSYYSIDVSR